MIHKSSASIEAKARELIRQANFELPVAVRERLGRFEQEETGAVAKAALGQIGENAKIAPREGLPLCQDTGTAVFFVEIGHLVRLDEPIEDILARATARAYEENHLRASIVGDPLFHRKNTGDNCPPVVHIEQSAGSSLKITFLPKGGGAENKSVLKMLRPVDGEAGIVQTVVDAASAAGGTSCPPWIIGIGIGGSFDSVASLAKKALLRPLGKPHSKKEYAKLEMKIAAAVEELKVGTLGFGGIKTVMGVHVEAAPTHIASLPVAVNFQCHSARSASIEL